MKLKEILESTITGGYPADGSTGPCDDDDLPTGTTVFGDKMVPKKVPNRLTGYTIKYVPADEVGEEWNYDEFENSQGMGSKDGYSKTLDNLKTILGDRLWKHTKDKQIQLSLDKKDARDDSDVDQDKKLSDDEEETMDITERISQWVGEDVVLINEEVLSAPDRKVLAKAILKSKNVQLKMKSLKVDANLTNYDDEVVVSYKPNEDFTMALVDVADSLGMDFQTTKDGSKTAFRIMK